jgi:hypothetical protein
MPRAMPSGKSAVVNDSALVISLEHRAPCGYSDNKRARSTGDAPTDPRATGETPVPGCSLAIKARS